MGSVGDLRARAGRPRPDPSGVGRGRAAWAIRALAPGALIFSKEAPDVLWGMGRCLWSIGALPRLMVWDREGCLHAGGGRPTDVYAGVLRPAEARLVFLRSRPTRRPRARSSVCRGIWRPTSSPAGASRTTSTSSCSSTRGSQKANARTHKTLQRPADRPARRGARGDARAARARARRRPPLGDAGAARSVLRFDTNDYSLDPGLVGRRVEVRVSPATDHRGGARHRASSRARHERSFAKNRTITALEHARALQGAPRRGRERGESLVEQRPLAVYDRLIA